MMSYDAHPKGQKGKYIINVFPGNPNEV